MLHWHTKAGEKEKTPGSWSKFKSGGKRGSGFVLGKRKKLPPKKARNRDSTSHMRTLENKKPTPSSQNDEKLRMIR